MWCAVVALRRGETRRQLVVPALTAAGLVFVIAYEWATTGHLFEWLRVENRTWGDHFGVSVQSAHRFIDFVTSGPLGLHQGQLNDFVWAGGWVLGLIGACVLVRTGLPLVLKVYGVAAFAFACLSYNVGPRPRLLLSAFPVVIVFAVIARGRAFRGLLFVLGRRSRRPERGDVRDRRRRTVITSSTRLRALEPVAVDRPVDLAPAPGRDARSVGSQDHLVLRTILLVCGAVFLVMYVVIAVAGWRYPYELEWMEGGVLTHVQRVLHGQSLYGRSSVRFTPFIYTPLYYYASAAAAWVIGPSLSTLRLVSILGSLLALGAVYRLVAAETKARWPGVVGACLLAACFRVAGAWLDLARVDVLFLGLLLAALVCVRGSESWRRALAAGALFGAAFLTNRRRCSPPWPVLPFLWRRGPRIQPPTWGR